VSPDPSRRGLHCDHRRSLVANHTRNAKRWCHLEQAGWNSTRRHCCRLCVGAVPSNSVHCIRIALVRPSLDRVGGSSRQRRGSLCCDNVSRGRSGYRPWCCPQMARRKVIEETRASFEARSAPRSYPTILIAAPIDGSHEVVPAAALRRQQITRNISSLAWQYRRLSRSILR
jgi:hypothetical protein